jgi:alkanesulfonate monooxygenase SsuD/methylene tetrahydromethanopterin reductase-like flavin-dependent oxidoreductase (luciferase family)
VIGTLIQAASAPQAIEQIVQAERAGVPIVWATSGGIGGADLLATWAAAAVQTSRVILGTSIVRTWPRHPVALAEETLAIEQLAPGRFRLGIGPTGEVQAVQTYGANYRKPLTQVREYLMVLRSLLYEGEVDFVGEHVTARARLRTQVRSPLMASAAGLRAFTLCGEVSDGAISWVAPKRYLVEQALPALRQGAVQAGRPVPPLIAHVPFAVNTDRQAARALAREQLAPYARSIHFRGTWTRAGYDDAEGYSDALLDDLLVSGSEVEVAAGLVGWIKDGMGEVLAHPLLDPNDRQGSLARGFAAIARAAREVAESPSSQPSFKP